MIVPGFGSGRVPSPVRLYIAAAVSLAVPNLSPFSTSQLDGEKMINIVIVEVLIGIAFGLSVKIMFVALDVVSEFISHSIGLSNNFGASPDGREQLLVVTSIVQLSAVAAFFSMNLHLDVVTALMDSYKISPIGSYISSEASMKEIVTTLIVSFHVAMRIAFPFIVFSLATNFSFGLINRVIPQLPAYFISIPIIIIGGLFILHQTIGPGVSLFMQEISLTLYR